MSNAVYIQRWNKWKQSYHSELPFEVELESQLFHKYELDNPDQSHSQLTETTSLPAPRRLSNPISSPPRLRTKSGTESSAPSIQSRLGNPNTVPQPSSIGTESILKLFDVYSSEMSRRKEQLFYYVNLLMNRYADMNEVTKHYFEDVERITSHFISVLEKQGISSSDLYSVINSLKCIVAYKHITH